MQEALRWPVDPARKLRQDVVPSVLVGSCRRIVVVGLEDYVRRLSGGKDGDG